MVSLAGKSIQTGMSFNSDPDSDDSDSDQGEHNDDIANFENPSRNLMQAHDEDNWEKKTVHTIWIGVLLIVATIFLLFVVGIIVTVECTTGPNKNRLHWGEDTRVEDGDVKYGLLCYVPSDSLIMYLQSILWGLCLICDQYIQFEQIKVRRRGYLEFYNKTRTLSQMPFCISSAWCALLLSVSTVLDDNCESDFKCGKKIKLGKADYALMFVGLERFLVLVCTSYYIFLVQRFNKTRVLPDVLRNEFMEIATDYTPNSSGEVDEEIFQRQADVIRYLSEQNVVLRKEVMVLNRQLSEFIPVQNSI